MIYDAHFHAEDASLLQYMQANHITGIVNAASPQEFQRLSAWLKTDNTIKISAGIHPWYAQRSSWEQMLPIMEQASIIGEIGLDNGAMWIFQYRQSCSSARLPMPHKIISR